MYYQKINATVNTLTATGFSCASQSGKMFIPQVLTLFCFLPILKIIHLVCLFLINASWCLIALPVWHLISNCYFIFINM